MSIKKFHNKYNVLVPETGSKGGKGGNFGNRLSNEKQQQANKDIDNELGDPKHVLFPPNKVLLEWKKVRYLGSFIVLIVNVFGADDHHRLARSVPACQIWAIRVS